MTAIIEQAFGAFKGSAVRTYRAPAAGVDPDLLWRLLATPDQWPRWSPHIMRVTEGHGVPPGPLRIGQALRIHGPWPVAVPARITALVPGRRWDFDVTLPVGVRVRAAHEVVDDPTAVVVTMRAAGPAMRLLGGPALLVYAPLAELALRRLVALARQRRTP
jgi:uncharacterized protein YndB with AHSA1/START domain